MANRYEQMEEAQPDPNATPLPPGSMPSSIIIRPSNRYEQMDTAPSKPAAAPKPSYTLGETLTGWPSQVYESGKKFAGNVRDMVMHPIDTIGNIGNMLGGAGAIGGMALAGGTPKTPDEEAQLLKEHPQIKHMIDTANAVGGQMKDRYGTWESIKRTIHDDPVGFMADLSTVFAGGAGAARMVGAGAARVGATGAAAAAGSAAGRAARVAAVSNPINWVAAPVAGAARMTGLDTGLARAADAILPGDGHQLGIVPNPSQAAQNALLDGAAEGRLPEVHNALVTANTPNPHGAAGQTMGQIVPDSGNPTAARAIMGMDRPPARMASLGRDAENRFPTQHDAIEEQQAAARLNQIRGDAGTAADLAADEATREANAATAYGAAGVTRRGAPPATPVMVSDDPALQTMFGSPSMPQVFARAEQIAQERRVPFQMGTTTPGGTRTVPNPFVPGSTMTVTDPPTWAQFPADSLHSVKLAFDDLIKDPEQFGVAASEVDAIRNTRNEFLNWFEHHNPAYGDARRQYALDSGPINRRQVLQYLQQKLTDPLMGEASPTQRAGMFANAVNEAPNAGLGSATVRRSTGQQRYNNIDEILTPPERERLQQIIDDMARDKRTDKLAGKGAKDYGGALNTPASDMLVGGLPGKAHPLVNLFLGGADRNIADRVGNAMLDSGQMEEMVGQAVRRQRQMQTVQDILRNAFNAARRTPGMYNYDALDPEKNKPTNAMMK